MARQTDPAEHRLDLWTIQETIFELKPALIVETGTNRGGSSYFYAQLFDLMGTSGRVVTIDTARQHDLTHPRITYLIGDSTSTAIVDEVRDVASSCGGPVFIILDSDHSEPHVARELELYAPLVTPGSYVLVQDGSIDTLGYFRGSRPRSAAGHPPVLCPPFGIHHRPEQVRSVSDHSITRTDGCERRARLGPRYTLMTSTSSLTAAADFLNAASSSGVSLISMIFSTPRRPA